MVQLKSVGVLSAAKISAAMGIVLGLIYAVIIFAVGSALSPFLASTPVGRYLPAIGLGLLIVVPVVVCVLSFICAAIEAFLYNVITPRIGYVEIDLKGGRLNHIGELSLGKVLGVAGVIIGFVAGVIIAFFVGPLISSMVPMASSVAWPIMIIAVPVVCGLLFFVGGILEAFVYNVLASAIGGVKLNIAKGELRSVEVVSYMKISGASGLIWGLVSGVLSFNAASLVTAPISNLVAGLIGAGVVGLLYNWLAKPVGGIKLDIR
ncbi:Uncharacterised protein [uncultured archaeon]|nr:Uncharacterised protein [uncultured archaeon]